MSQTTTVSLLVIAAILEVGGDAIVRAGLHRSGVTRFAAFLAGGLMLFVYAYAVNSPPWDFGRLLGVYIVLFFIVAQFVSWMVFQTAPTTGLIVGGAFIVAGGAILVGVR